MPRGVIAVVAMPFDDEGAIDAPALEHEVHHLLRSGVDGIAIGFGSESTYLTDRERDAALRIVVEAVAGRCPIVAPIVVSSVVAGRERAATAAGLGADIVMVTPPPGSALDFFRSVADATSCAIMIQDAPTVTGTPMSDELILGICESPAVRAVKIETPDGYARISRLRSRVPDSVALLGGNGGLQLMSELRAGSDGTMPGAGNAAAIVRIHRLFRSGHEAEAEASFEALQPLLVLAAATPEGFLFTQKELLRRDGVPMRTALRAGLIEADAPLNRELAHVLARSQVRSGSAGPGTQEHVEVSDDA